ncbi:hypothetical protein BACCAP_00907 [Pseudoflavonifractor capillosus ATCC 29799]|uniref:Uncharacterized protein n=1 Tax=Pseudoflavonifractor capillosus ATCC 29799 TaxID=411467 RepID=A6NRS9_9FIRM|nr:hypothetical protein BACCAP_00907 [Pseudoflavonifractor capillosus ATCC 29799]
MAFQPFFCLSYFPKLFSIFFYFILRTTGTILNSVIYFVELCDYIANFRD